MDGERKISVRLERYAGGNYGYSRDVFDYILTGTPFEQYKSELFDRLLSAKLSENIFIMKDENDRRYKKVLLEQKMIAEALLCCKTNKFRGIYSDRASNGGER